MNIIKNIPNFHVLKYYFIWQQHILPHVNRHKTSKWFTFAGDVLLRNQDAATYFRVFRAIYVHKCTTKYASTSRQSSCEGNAFYVLQSVARYVNGMTFYL